MSPLHEPLLTRVAARHGFGLEAAAAPPGLALPRQVHGAAVVEAAACANEPRPEADAVLATQAGIAVGVVTADCVPILLAAPGGAAVAAVHAGWRGLARGVVAAAVGALGVRAGVEAGSLVAGIGPHIGPCCYEVDAPVLDALRAALGNAVEGATRAARQGHAMLDLAALTVQALGAAGVPAQAVGRAASACTFCDPRGYHSYRRDGSAAGRLVHFIAAGAAELEG